MAEKIYLSTDYQQILEKIYVYTNLYLSRLDTISNGRHLAVVQGLKSQGILGISL